jgi:hypothetical protein
VSGNGNVEGFRQTGCLVQAKAVVHTEPKLCSYRNKPIPKSSGNFLGGNMLYSKKYIHEPKNKAT